MASAATSPSGVIAVSRNSLRSRSLVFFRPVGVRLGAFASLLPASARLFLGGPKKSRALAGSKLAKAPNLTPTGLKKTSDRDLKEFLLTAMTPDGDVAAEAMAEVVRNTTSQLTPQDLDALIAYLRSLP